jgi:hypothetical protein
MVGAYSMYGRKRGTYRVLVGKPAGNRPLGRVILKRNFKKWDGER